MSSVLGDIRNSFNRTGNGLSQIIIINVIVFVALVVLKVILTISGYDVVYRMIGNQMFLPANLNEFVIKPWTIFSYFFSHEDFFHILFNMMFLYWFGMLISEFLGSKRLISLYILGGIAGGLIYLIAYNTIPYFIDRGINTQLLGASGAVYAVVVGAAVLIPDYTFFLLFLGPVKIKYIAIFYAFLSFAQTIGPNAGGNIAHLGGALMGFVFIWQLRKGNDWGKPIYWVSETFSSIFTKKPNLKVTFKNTETKKASSKPDSITQEEIDSILDKISKHGYEKLTKDEKQKLFKASQSTQI